MFSPINTMNQAEKPTKTYSKASKEFELAQDDEEEDNQELNYGDSE